MASLLQPTREAIVSSIPSSILASAMVAEDDPIATACMPHAAVIACVRGVASESDLSVAMEWIHSRPKWQERATKILERMVQDMEKSDTSNLPGWLGHRWSAVVRCPWASGLDDAVLEGEAFFGLHP